jgi:hypothetical protein
MKLKNIEIAAMYLLLHGPARAHLIQKAIYMYRHGNKMWPKRSNYYNEYFRSCHTRGYNLGCRYVYERGNERTALWKRNEESKVWTLTPRGLVLACIVVERLETASGAKIKLRGWASTSISVLFK